MVIETAVIVAIITGCFTLLGNYMMLQKNKQEEEAKRQVRDKEVELKLSSIEEKLDIHNGYAEKLGDIAISLAEIRTELKVMKEKG